MPISLKDTVEQLDPKNTVLLLGSGATIPSGAPKVETLVGHYAEIYGFSTDFTLSEITSLAENKTDRSDIIKELRKFFRDLRPKGGIEHLPVYDWKSIYTTNYDHIVEDAYAAHSKKCRVYASDFDFGISEEFFDCPLFKIHGTIEKDQSDGHQSRIILTETDYDNTSEFRQKLYDRLNGDLADANLLIIGQSLADQHLMDLVRRVVSINSASHSSAKIFLLLYNADTDRAALYEQKGISVCFGGIDELFVELAKQSKATTSRHTESEEDDLVMRDPILREASIDVRAVSDIKSAEISSMFNGCPATYSDILAGFTFDRDVAQEIVTFFDEKEEESLCAAIIGAAGVGKSTCARQAMQKLRSANFRCWEHETEHTLSVEKWVQVANNLRSEKLVGALFVDDAHLHLFNVNDLIDRLVENDNPHLKIIVASTRNNWYPRVKTPNLYKYGLEFPMSRLSSKEIDRLLRLIERQREVRELVEATFSGFSRQEKRRRIAHQCEADMFVCLKNIFASESMDGILLREYAELSPEDQEIYKHVAGMEAAGIRVHRQLVLRLLKLPADRVQAILERLDEIVHEHPVDTKLGIYAWRCRHQVISSILTKYKYGKIEDTIDLFERVINCISPSYDIEIRTLRELCNIDSGLARISDKKIQNQLLRKMISSAPGERIPRHRLIRNLIDMGLFERADAEIRVFEGDFGADGPVYRYKIRLGIARAVNTKGIMQEDRIAMLLQTQELASSGVSRFPNNKNVLGVCAELGIEYYRLTGSFEIFDQAMADLKEAEKRIGDPDISSIIRRYQRQIAGQSLEVDDEKYLD